MPYKLLAVALTLVVCVPALAQEAQDTPDTWTWSHRLEIRADYRWSDDEQHPLRFVPPGVTEAFLTTPDPGSHVELNTVDLQLDLGYGEWMLARAKVHAAGLHRRNPTSSDRKFDADELFVRFGPKPEFLERPAGTTFFLQAGKAPRIERQPVRLLESYGLAATSFNRFEDVQAIVGGTVGRNFYWRLSAANGNPLFFRDPNALAGDNGTPELRTPPFETDFGPGFPILYNAETEELFFTSDHVQFGQAVGYRWQTDDESSGFDILAFHYKRDLAETRELTGTFYGGDLDLLNGPFDLGGLPMTNRQKEEYGARFYGEWNNATLIAQYTRQDVAGLERDGWEIETGYRFPLQLGWIESVQPALRASGLSNDFVGNPVIFPTPSIWWNWTKFDGGVRVGMKHGLDVTLEYTRHNVGSRFKLHLQEVLATVRWRV
ncbi:MAG TPA: hypothetical protein VHL59_01425 [Thermoanaerobaculia bacterium]|nr:hypothetical protein [Thermoanaerobaculia bacterium]